MLLLLSFHEAIYRLPRSVLFCVGGNKGYET